MKTLSSEEVATLLQEHPAWTLSEGKIVREWTFTTFKEAMGFVNQIALIAEEADHHPDFNIRYNRVQLALISHDSGGITRRDARMVADLDGRFSAK